MSDLGVVQLAKGEGLFGLTSREDVAKQTFAASRHLEQHQPPVFRVLDAP